MTIDSPDRSSTKGSGTGRVSKRRGKIVLVDDDPALLRLLSIRLRTVGHEVEAVEDGVEGLKAVTSFGPDLVITDLRMDRLDGMRLLEELHQRRPSLPVLIITAHGTIPEAVLATQNGAFGFLTKPVDKDELLDCVDRALRLTGSSEPQSSWSPELVTRSACMEELLSQARMVAGTDTSVLIRGESGTGKELLARAIHKASPRREGKFVAVNCGAIPEQLLESELFGHEKGAFTGATRSHSGLFLAADKGTLFLDEIGDMPIPLQVKLLRVLQERQVRPVGSTQAIPLDVRVISATHQALEKSMKEGRFREDLYYRLNVVNLHVPALAERREDIPLLVARFLETRAAHNSEASRVYAPEAMELLVAADWPGNVRQLQNVVEQNVALSPTQVISARLVRKALGNNLGKLPSYADARDEFTRSYLTQLLNITRGNVSKAARLAKRNRTDFYKLLARHQIEPVTFKANRDSV